MIEVIPAILENDFTEIEKKVHAVEKLVTWVQIDIADGTLVPNTTFLDPDPFAKITTPLKFELHLMVNNPLKYVENFAKVGFKRFYAHIEGDAVEEYIELGYKLGLEVGLAIDGPSAFEKIHEYIDNLDGVLVMAIDAGFSGRPFREDTMDKIKQIRAIDIDIPITVDGAMNLTNAEKVVNAGATRINSNSYLFQSNDIAQAIDSLRQLGTQRKFH